MTARNTHSIMRLFSCLLAAILMMGCLPMALAEDAANGFALWFNPDGATSVAAGQQGGLPVYALEDMAAKENTVAVGEVTAYTVQGSNNPKAAGENAKGVIPDTGAAMYVVAPADGTVTVHGINGTNKDGTGKTFWQVKVVGEEIAEVTNLTDAGQVSVPVTVKEGETVWFYCNGSKFQFAGIEFVADKSAAAPVVADAAFTFNFNADGATGVTAGTVANGNILILEDMAAKENTVTIGEETLYTVQGSNNPKAAGENAKGVIPDTGAAIAVTAPADGTITVTGINGTNKDGTGKTFWQVKVVGGEIADVTSTTEAGQISIPVAVKAGETVWFYCNGSKFQFAQVAFEAEGVAEAAAEPVPMTADDRAWQFVRFGTSTSDAANRIAEGADIKDKVTLYSCTVDDAGKVVKKGGKFVSDAPADGVSFYYTTIDPTTENFRLTADVTIDYMNPTPDGQEGFALQLRDTINGSGSYFSNTMSVGSSKLSANGKSTYSLLGTRNYTGIVDAEKSDANTVDATLEAFTITPVRQGQTYRVSLEKTSYGYVTTQYRIQEDGSTGDMMGQHIFYIPAKDLNATSVSSYAELDDPMCVQEGNQAYLALVCARGMNVTFSNIEFVTGPWNAAEWMVQPTTYTDPHYVIKSGDTAPNGQYTLVFEANADGVATISVDGKVVEEALPIAANAQFEKTYPMEKRGTVSVTFTPNADFMFGPHEALSTYETIVTDVYVMSRSLGAEDGTIYVAPNGRAMNDGVSKDAPTDIFSAISYACAGQKILLQPGHYELNDEEGEGIALTIARGHDGTKDAPIIMTCDGGYATLDFCKTGKGLTCWGDWWEMSYINICNTADKQKGMQLAGKNCTLRHMNFYNNGTTGLQISGTSNEPFELWPANNTVEYCTAMNNGDSSYEDADGFAAKLTCGEGNVFRGCIAAYNADDGWDMFAKAGTGEIGAVEIYDSLCYRNGYLMVKPGSDKYSIRFADMECDGNGNLTFLGELGKDYFQVEAGNGNGFKMGGTNIPGDHKLYNSISYENKAKGIDSNSCPDIKAYDCTTFNNGSYNVAYYTNNKSATTGYAAEGVLSFRTDKLDVKEQIGLNGQSSTDVYGEYNFFWNNEEKVSRNSKAVNVDASWFESLDTAAAPTRNADGTINMHGLLMLTEAARAYESGAQGKAWGQSEQEKATFWVVGDSTACGFSDSYYLPRQGWGEQLERYFSATVYNLAHSGASSKDFTGMSEYQALLNGSDTVPALGNTEGEKFLFIGFGHNDQKTEAARYTNPNGDYQTEGSFANSLYVNYIKPAMDAGVTPVLVTPIARLTSDNTAESYISASGHIIKDTTVGDVTYAGGDYAQAIRDLCEALDLICIDMTKATIERNVAMGEAAQWLHAWNGAKFADDGVTMVPAALDKTHTSSYGAKANAWQIAKLSEGTALAAFLKAGKVEPTYESDFADAINPDYVPVIYTAPTTTSAAWPAFTDAQGNVWYGTVFGDIGGENKIASNFFAKPVDGGMNIGVTGNAGKISSATDGMIFYYTALPAGTSFTLSATATINDMAANNQVSFGLMARDDLYIDSYVKDTMGDYVAAGTRNQGAFNGFGRKSGVLFNGPAAEKVYAIGDTIDLQIVGTADGYTLTYGENTPVSAGFDYALTTVDENNIYVGFYAVRNADITFTNVKLVLN